jgi:hypothetical protein
MATVPNVLKGTASTYKNKILSKRCADIITIPKKMPCVLVSVNLKLLID